MLRDDLSSCMTSILHMLNTICPRSVDSLLMSNKVEKQGMCGSTNLPRIEQNYTSKSHQPHSSSHRVVNSDSPTKAVPLPSPSSPTRPHSDAMKSILGILRSSINHKKSLVGEQCEGEDTNSNIRCRGGERSRNRRKVRVTDISDRKSGVTGVTDAEYVHLHDERLLVRAFGPRKYGMSQSTWTLIILSRRCAQQVTVM